MPSTWLSTRRMWVTSRGVWIFFTPGRPLVQATLTERARLHRAALAFSEEIGALADTSDAPDLVAMCRNLAADEPEGRVVR